MRSPWTATKSSPRLLQLEKARAQQRKPNAAKNKQMNKFIKKKVEVLLLLADLELMTFKVIDIPSGCSSNHQTIFRL